MTTALLWRGSAGNQGKSFQTVLFWNTRHPVEETASPDPQWRPLSCSVQTEPRPLCHRTALSLAVADTPGTSVPDRLTIQLRDYQASLLLELEETEYEAW